MRTIVMAAAGCAALLAGTAATTTTHASGGLLGLLGRSQQTQQGQRLLSTGGTLPLNPGSLLACANILHAGGIYLIGSGKQLGTGCNDTRLGAGYGTTLLTLPPLPATPILGGCQTLLQNVSTMLPLVGFPVGTGDGIRTSCAGHPSPLDPLTQLLGLG